ncbi:prophage regulatory protein-like protein [Legionella geestiana]|uniref:Prophage regulatory protein-like protein n=1 Tax=Legionella geestiana TaxID=45065 RepID=A0A0W0U2L1_9GAMM|nr:AlpA family phage regulatory protein [Legionella geestiana]KTD02120.1 prophage regulatory protein-like protein [Legionella geestiana]QBS11554.1 AlpA family phage regulatory protein [Legionella geestiana]STX53772.1 prophage regulatory protein-like protein [Legionella geestiana]
MEQIRFKQQVLFIKDVEQIIGRHRMTLRRWWVQGKFPKPFKLNDSMLSWHHDVIEEWVNRQRHDSV